MFDLAGKQILVTGAAGLLGRAIVESCANAGASVCKTDLGIRLFPLDVTNPDSWKWYADNIGVDGLVNCAGITQNTPGAHPVDFFDYSLEDWNRVLEVNLTGTFLGCQIIGREMVKRGRGSIVNFGSLYGMGGPHFEIYEGTGLSQPPAYAASKAAVIGLTKYLAALYGPAGVRVNCVTPGGVYNDQPPLFVHRFEELVPMHRMATPADVAAAVVYLMSDEAQYVTGHNLVVDGGFSAW